MLAQLVGTGARVAVADHRRVEHATAEVVDGDGAARLVAAVGESHRAGGRDQLHVETGGRERGGVGLRAVGPP